MAPDYYLLLASAKIQKKIKKAMFREKILMPTPLSSMKWF
jgi:hypothetical protein